MPRIRRKLLLAFGLVGLAVGCQEEQIERYRATKVPVPKAQMVTAIFRQPERTWFLKLVGPEEAVKAQRPVFDRFLGSVKFTGKNAEPISWEVPAGWQKSPGDGLRYATFKFGSKEEPLEVSVTPLDKDAGSLLDNVNRWRKQMGLRAIPETDLPAAVERKTIHDVPVEIVELTGSFPKGPPMMGRAGGPPITPLPPPSASLRYTTPAGWEKQPAEGLRKAAFLISKGDERAEVTVIALGRESGSALQNINRWREQIGLPETTAEAVVKEVEILPVAGEKALYVDLVGPAQSGKRILGAFTQRGSQMWYFKMIGPAELVGREKANFEAFLRSVRFE